jgi:hypothetical protein
MGMIDPPRWSVEELASESEQAKAVFRKERLEEPLEDYLEVFEQYQGNVEELFETTVDLTNLDDTAASILTDKRLLHAFRYLAGPPISEDDLKTVAEAGSLVASRLKKDAEAVRRIVDVIRIGLDRRRFPWVGEDREATESEKLAAIIASSALMATQRTGTQRRSLGKRTLEGLTEGALTGIGFVKVATRKVRTYVDAPDAGQFCGEAYFGERKADFIVRLWDNRVMPIECKASNSEINSLKRVNNDAAAKAEAWRADFGESQVVPVAVISGVFKPANLFSAQTRGLTLFWGHNLKPLTDWIEKTRNA